MIAFLRGQKIEQGDDFVIVDVNGVGYEINCSNSTMNDLETKSDIQIWIHTSVREDAIQLFGFSTFDEKQIFLNLLKVNGIGPKMAQAVLSGARAEEISNMIESGDEKALSSLPRIGKKKAQQIILSLKGKLVSHQDKTSVAQEGTRKQIVTALVNLGFRLQDVEKVVKEMEVNVGVHKGVRDGLVALTSQA